MILDGVHSDGKQVSFLFRGLILLCDIEVLDLGDSLVQSDNVNLGLVAHLAGCKITTGQGTLLPFLLIAEAATTETVSSQRAMA